MPYKLILFILSVSYINLEAQKLPWKDYPVLFHDVQLSGIFPDSKTFADCSPLLDSLKTDSTYKAEKEKDGFKLIDFVNTYFVLDTIIPPETKYDTARPTRDYILSMMEELIKEPNPRKNSLIDLKYPYIVNAPSAKEVKYYDSYYLMLGLEAMGDKEMNFNMLKNFSYLIEKYGYIPYGNRSYYLNRSALPVFHLMLQNLENLKDNELNNSFLSQLEKEYKYWMSGKELLSENNKANNRVVLMPNGAVLNRHWSDEKTPRPEVYKEDMIAYSIQEKNSSFYKNIRAKQEGQWISCSEKRIIKEYDTVLIENIVPIALNSLLYTMELELSKKHKDADNRKASKHYFKLAKERKKTMRKYLWNTESDFYADYHLNTGKTYSDFNQQCLFPLISNLAKKKEGKRVLEQLITDSMEDKGIKYIQCESKQEICCYPPELQYLAYEALNSFGYNTEAEKIKVAWTDFINKSIYSKAFCSPDNETPIGLIFSVYLYFNPE